MWLIPEYEDDNGGTLNGIESVEEAVTAAAERKDVAARATHWGHARFDLEDSPTYYENVPEDIEE